MPFRDAGYVPGGPYPRGSLPGVDDDTLVNLAYRANDLYRSCVRQGKAGWIKAGESGRKRRSQASRCPDCPNRERCSWPPRGLLLGNLVHQRLGGWACRVGCDSHCRQSEECQFPSSRCGLRLGDVPFFDDDLKMYFGRPSLLHGPGSVFESRLPCHPGGRDGRFVRGRKDPTRRPW